MGSSQSYDTGSKETFIDDCLVTCREFVLLLLVLDCTELGGTFNRYEDGIDRRGVSDHAF